MRAPRRWSATTLNRTSAEHSAPGSRRFSCGPASTAKIACAHPESNQPGSSTRSPTSAATRLLTTPEAPSFRRGPLPVWTSGSKAAAQPSRTRACSRPGPRMRRARAPAAPRSSSRARPMVLVPSIGDAGVDAGGSYATGATAKCACKISADRVDSKHFGSSVRRQRRGLRTGRRWRQTADGAAGPRNGDEQGAHGSRGADLVCFHGGCESGGAEAAAPGRRWTNPHPIPRSSGCRPRTTGHATTAAQRESGDALLRARRAGAARLLRANRARDR